MFYVLGFKWGFGDDSWIVRNQQRGVGVWVHASLAYYAPKTSLGPIGLSWVHDKGNCVRRLGLVYVK